MPQHTDPGSHPDYARVSEIPGIRVTREAVSMLLTRYAFASDFCKGKDVLELGCGAGIGLGYLSRYARTLVGGDYTESMLSTAKREHCQHARLVRLDAQRLPFKENSFDVILLFEAIYYLPSPALFLHECRRVLRPRGTLLICSANKEHPGFSPSALSCGYFSALELGKLLTDNGFEGEIYGAFRSAADSCAAKAIELIRRFAVRLRLIPRTMRRKEFLKRIFYGGLVEMGTSIAEGMAPYSPPVLIPRGANRVADYRVIYAVAQATAAQTTGHGSLLTS